MSEGTISSDTELRKLKLGQLSALGHILNISDSWKKLMEIIPKHDTSNLPKFKREHMSMIEYAAQRQKTSAAELFLVEWGTMGKKRPTVGTLKDLLVKAQLFRAADYVAENILKENPPKRPSRGPAAPVDTSEKAVEMIIRGRTMIEFQYKDGSSSEPNDNKDIDPNRINNTSLDGNLQEESTKLFVTKGKHPVDNSSPNDAEISDLIKFTKEQIVNSAPFPRVYNSEDNGIPTDELPRPLLSAKYSEEQTNLTGLMRTDERPVFLNDISSSTDEQFNEITEDTPSDELLPLCIVDFNKNSKTRL